MIHDSWRLLHSVSRRYLLHFIRLDMKFLLCLLMMGCSSLSAQSSFVIEGRVPEALDRKELELTIEDTYSEKPFKNQYFVTVKNKTFRFAGKISKPSEWGYLMMGKGNFFYFIIDTGLNKMTVHPVDVRSPFRKNQLSNSSITGSVANNVYKQIKDLGNAYYNTYGKPAAANSSIIEIDKNKRGELKLRELAVLAQNPTVFFSLIYLCKVGTNPVQDYELLSNTYHQLSEEIKQTPLGAAFKERLRLAQGVRVGQNIPAFSLTTEKGVMFQNESLSGKAYLIAFGATWCKPCKDNYPFLVSLYNKYKGKGFEIVGVNIDEKEKEWKRQIASFGLTWIHVSELVKWDKSFMVRLFNVAAVPYYILVDTNGVIVYNSLQLADYDQKLLEPNVVRLFN